MANPTDAQFDLMQPGDGCYFKHGRAKNDFCGTFFAPTPSFLPFFAHSPRNACRALRLLEKAARAAGMTAGMRATTPLFGMHMGEEFSHWEVETLFEIMLRFGAGVSHRGERELRSSCCRRCTRSRCGWGRWLRPTPPTASRRAFRTTGKSE